MKSDLVSVVTAYTVYFLCFGSLWNISNLPIFSKSLSSWQNKRERVLLKIQKKIQSALLCSSRSEIFFRMCSILRSRILGERQGNATWNAPRTRSVKIFLLGYFCPVLYTLLFACYFIYTNKLHNNSLLITDFVSKVSSKYRLENLD